MKQTLLDLFTSKKFLAAVTAITIYVAGRFGFDVDTAVLDRIFAAFLVYVGAQGVADVGKEAEKARSASFRSFGVPQGLETGAQLRSSASPLTVLALVVLGLSAAGSMTACTAAQRTATLPAIVDCTSASSAAIGDTAASMRGSCATAGATDWKCVTAKAIAAGLQIGGCAFLDVLGTPTSTARLAPATGPTPPDREGRAAFESYRASQAGGAAFRTAAGER